MFLRRITAQNYRCFANKISIGSFTEGLNIITGPNESGKSTLFQCVQSALFGMTSKQRLEARPYNVQANPYIIIEFEHGDSSYTLKKRLGQKTYTLLQNSNTLKTWQGKTAEQYLQQMLTFEKNDIGFWDMIWSCQGQTFEPKPDSQNESISLRSSLERTISDIYTGMHDKTILAEIEKHYKDYWTPTGKHKTEKGSQNIPNENKTLDQIKKHYDELCQEKTQYDTLKHSLAVDDDHLKEIEKRLEEKVQHRDHMRTIAHAKKDVELAHEKHQSKQKDAKHRSDMITEVAHLHVQLTEAKQQDHQAESTWRTLNLAQLRQQYQDAEQVSKVLEQARAQLNELTQLTTKQMDNLRRYKQELTEAEKELTTTEKMAYDDTDLIIKIHDSLLSPSLYRRLNQTKVGRWISNALEWFLKMIAAVLVKMIKQSMYTKAQHGIIKISSSHSNRIVEDNQANVEKCRHVFKNALTQMGMDTIDKAEQQFQRQQTLKEQIKQYESSLIQHAPEDLHALKKIIDSEEQELETLHNTIEEYQPLDRAQSLMLQNSPGFLEQAKQEHIKTQADYRSRKKVYEERKHTLDHERSILSDQEIDEALNKTKQYMLELEIDEEYRKAKQRSQAQGIDNIDDVDHVVKQVESEYEALVTEHNNLQQNYSDKKGQLKKWEQSRLEEQLTEAQNKYEYQKSKVNKLKRDAEAIKYLHQTLDEVDIELRSNLVEPIANAAQPYLSLLFDQARIVIEKSDLTIGGITRTNEHNETHDQFENLSIGTREQIAVITRLAFVHLLSEQNRRGSIILDDPFGNCDRPRIERMKKVLKMASKTMQILLLTCRPEEYQNLEDYQDRNVPIWNVTKCYGAPTSL